MADTDFNPARFKACTRRTVTFAVIFSSLGFILIAVLLSILVDDGKNEAAKKALNSVTPLAAGFIGATMAFYFSEDAGDDDDDNDATVVEATRNIIFARNGVFPLTYTVNLNDFDEGKTMKQVLRELNADPENPGDTVTPFFDLKEPDDGTKEFKFSIKENLRNKKYSTGEFHSITLSELLKKVGGESENKTIVVTVTFEKIPRSGTPSVVSMLSGSLDHTEGTDGAELQPLLSVEEEESKQPATSEKPSGGKAASTPAATGKKPSAGTPSAAGKKPAAKTPAKTPPAKGKKPAAKTPAKTPAAAGKKPTATVEENENDLSFISASGTPLPDDGAN